MMSFPKMLEYRGPEKEGLFSARLKRQDRERFLCSLFAPREAREGLNALYALDLELAAIPSKVSEPLLGQIRYQWWRDSVEGISHGATPRHDVAQALEKTMAQFDLSAASIHDLINARSAILTEEPLNDMAALLSHVEGIYGTLASLSLDTLGIKGPETRKIRETVRLVAIAFGLCRVLVALPGQIRPELLPRNLMDCEGIKGDVWSQKNAASLSRVVWEIAEIARKHIDEARSNRDDIPSQSLTTALPVLLPALCAESILNRLSKADYRISDPYLIAPQPFLPLTLLYHGARRRY